MKQIYFLAVLVILFLFSSHLFSQQLPLFTQYQEYSGIVNPASVKSDFFVGGFNLSMGLSYRNQWTSIEGTPQTQLARAEYITDFGILAGGYVINDQTGPLGMTGLYGRIAGMTLTDDPEFGSLNIGLSGGIVQYRLKTDEFKPRDPGDINTLQGDNQFFPDVGFGLYYHTSVGRRGSDNFFAGFSIPQVFGLDVKNSGMRMMNLQSPGSLIFIS